ncbi:hypothetical protein B0T20DRAFT_389079 [Sordaria brevicollis]|uniref:Uncharacterized protein n=1 Tax=Sordaria brevicollis TaxID=83679 RepID=A0AAE0PQ03_SORBR|nr:hypothetical protein B0T20DRAFT_389079 [Sordaria brevicollis]
MPSQNKKPLRQVAAEKLNGPNANPSQLGDPISMKSETNTDTPPGLEYTPEGAEKPASSRSSRSSAGPSNKTATRENRTKAYGSPRNDPAGGSSGGKKKDNAPRTPSGKRVPLEGDPSSLEREQVVGDARGVREEENGPVGRGRASSKL